MRASPRLAAALVSPLGLVLTVVIMIPAGILLVYSFFTSTGFDVQADFVLSNWKQVVDDEVYRTFALHTVEIALPTTVLTVLGGFVLAYYAALRASPRKRAVVLALVILSFMSSYLALIYSWRTLMGDEGIVNTVLESAGVIDKPLGFLLFSKGAVVVAETNFLLPLSTLIIYSGLGGVSEDLIAAARDLGAGRLRTLKRVVLPLCGRAVFAATLFVFFFSSGDYYTPVFLGGLGSGTLGTAIADQLSSSLNYPLGAAISFTMVIGFVVFTAVVWAAMRAARLLPRYA